MFMFKRPGDRRLKAAVDEKRSARGNDELPLPGNITGLELLVLFLSRQHQSRH